MPLPRALSKAGLLLALLLASMLTRVSVAQPASSQVPPEVTTDTPAYCWFLADRLHSMEEAAPAPPSHEVADLSTAGQYMCKVGQTRQGIMRLRRALMLIMHKDDMLGR